MRARGDQRAPDRALLVVGGEDEAEASGSAAWRSRDNAPTWHARVMDGFAAFGRGAAGACWRPAGLISTLVALPRRRLRLPFPQGQHRGMDRRRRARRGGRGALSRLRRTHRAGPPLLERGADRGVRGLPGRAGLGRLGNGVRADPRPARRVRRGRTRAVEAAAAGRLRDAGLSPVRPRQPQVAGAPARAPRGGGARAARCPARGRGRGGLRPGRGLYAGAGIGGNRRLLVPSAARGTRAGGGSVARRRPRGRSP